MPARDRRPGNVVSDPARPLRVDARPVHPDLERDLGRVQRMATLLDSQFSLGGIKFGWDSIIGLVPVVGDVVTGGMALYAVALARKHDVGRVTTMRMLANVGIDVAAGAVPLVGDVFDVAFKANRKNFELFRRAVEKRHGVRVNRVGGLKQPVGRSVAPPLRGPGHDSSTR